MENNENNVEMTGKEECGCKCNCKKCICLIAIMTFLGSFLAFYFLMHQSMMHFFRHHHKHDMMRFEQNFENDFKKIKNHSEKDFQMLKNNLSSIQTSKYEDEYIIVINLKPFNNDENNIKFDLSGNTVTVTGNITKDRKNGENSYYFTESYNIPDKIDKKKITKEKIMDKYVITLPIEN